jgi:ribosomal protein L12E/L44/L45/RPP1/RPP2
MTEILACSYASFLLFDASVPVTEKNISEVLKAAGVKVSKSTAQAFADNVTLEKLETLISKFSSVGSSSSGPAVSEKKETKQDKKEEKPKEEEKKSEEESGGDVGFGLFGEDEE